MKRLLAVLVLVLVGASAYSQTITETFGSGVNEFQIEFVTIGNLGNPADTTGSPNPVGSVNYVYNIGKFEISRSMIAKFNASQSLQIGMADLSSSGGNGINRPATGISWNEAARFVNWLNTSRGYQAPYLFSGGGINDDITVWSSVRASGNNLFRHKNAQFFLPSLDEWYKAAYGSPSGTWYNYPTGSDTAPAAVADGTTQGTAVYNQFAPADITNAGGWSPYQTMAQGGNAHEWMESAFDGLNDSSTELRGMRGGSWDRDSFQGGDLRNDNYGGFTTNYSTDDLGFRVAMVPEPSSLSLLLAGGVVLMAGRRRKVVMLSCSKIILFALGFTFFCFDGVAETQTNTVVRRERLKPFMDGEWGYISENNGATIVRYDGQGGTVTTPSKLGGLPVKKINGGLNFNPSIRKIIIPPTVTSLGFGAFAGLDNLIEVLIPDSVTNISGATFSQCKKLPSVNLPEGLESLENDNFFECGMLTNVILPKRLTSIGPQAFYGCKSLANISVPKNVKIIQSRAFYACTALMEVVLPEGLEIIGDEAFAGCVNLININIPKSVNVIDEKAFDGCVKLPNETLKKIENIRSKKGVVW